MYHWRNVLPIPKHMKEKKFLELYHVFDIFFFFIKSRFYVINVNFLEHLHSTHATLFIPQTFPMPLSTNPPPPQISDKSSSCILKGTKIFTLSKVVKGFFVHTGTDKEEAPSAWPKGNCWNKSAHTKTLRDNGAGSGPDPETETHCAPEHTERHTRTHRELCWEQSLHID